MKLYRCSPGQLLFVALLGATALLTHLVDGYAWCQEYWNWDGKRNSKDGRRWPAGDGVVITYINGIFHSVPEWESITHQLQAIFGHEVRPFYNPSSGWWITDASKAGYHLLRRPANDTIAQALGEHLAQAVDDVGRGRVLHIAHSGGALITYLAAQHHLTRSQRDKIDVLTFGGARSITRKYFSGRVVNYYARNDPLVKLDRRAADLMKHTNDTKFQEVSEKHNTTFIFLEGRARQFVIDHSLEGPTYQHALRKEAKAFRRAHFGPLSPLSWDYEYSLLRLVRKKAAQLSGIHDFFSTERFGLRSVRKTVARLTGFHGFFSGKIPGTGAQLPPATYGLEGPLETQPRGAGFWATIRQWRPWGGRDREDVSAALTVGEEPPVGEQGVGEATADQRFWLGFRWSLGGKGEPAPEDARDQPPPSVVVDLEVVDEVALPSRWEKVRGAWIFSRNASTAQDEEEEKEEQVVVIAETEVEEEGESPPREEGSLEGQSPPVVERPWLSIDWTPWGAAKKPVVETCPDEAPPAEASVVDGDGVLVVDGESSEDVTGGEEGGGGMITDVETASDGQSYFRRWWPGQPTREAAPAAGGVAQDKGIVVREEETGVVEADFDEGGGVAPGQRDGEAAGGTGESSPVEGDTSLLRRWWPVRKELTLAEIVVQDEEQEGTSSDGVDILEEEEEGDDEDDNDDGGEVARVSAQEDRENQTEGVEQPASSQQALSPVSSRLRLFFSEALGFERRDGAPVALLGEVSYSEEETEEEDDALGGSGGDSDPLIGEVINIETVLRPGRAIEGSSPIAGEEDSPPDGQPRRREGGERGAEGEGSQRKVSTENGLDLEREPCMREAGGGEPEEREPASGGLGVDYRGLPAAGTEGQEEGREGAGSVKMISIEELNLRVNASLGHIDGALLDGEPTDAAVGESDSEDGPTTRTDPGVFDR